jgi:hypothetical protein
MSILRFLHDWRRTIRGVQSDPEFIALVMSHWDTGTKDTRAIASLVNEHESVVAVALRLGREERRKTS